MGELPAEEDELSFLLRIKALFNVGCVKHSPFTGKPIREVAICGGSGAFLIKDAIAYGADVFITGEAKYNDFYDVEDRIYWRFTVIMNRKSVQKTYFIT